MCMGERWCAGKAGEEGKVRAGDMFIRPVSPAHSPMLRIDPRRPPRVKKGGNKGAGETGGMAVGEVRRGGKGGIGGNGGIGVGGMSRAPSPTEIVRNEEGEVAW